jgi:hypothetical protein
LHPTIDRAVIKPDFSFNFERRQMTKAYEKACTCVRWAIISTFVLIMVLPALISLGTYI